ncbi:MAG: LrgB family protein [Betaproteobacteria bacterium]|nr:LrgB family protein [Betaproteobacteria bacterium]
MNPPPIFDLWVFLKAKPLLWLVLTLGAWVMARRLQDAAAGAAWANPVAGASVLLGSVLWLTNTPYEEFFAGAQFVHFLLGPTTIALGVTIIEHGAAVRRQLIPVVGALLVGVSVSVGCTWVLCHLVGLPADITMSLLPKSATAPVAMSVSESIGGIPSISMCAVLLTGVTGAVIVTPLFNLCRFGNWNARGFAAGLTAHGIGTARAYQVSNEVGVYAALALALAALVQGIVLPLML